MRHMKKKGNPLTMKEKKVSNKRKQNFTLSQSKENFANIEKEAQAGAKLLASQTSSVSHRSTTSSSRLNFPTINVDNKRRKACEELLSIALHMDTLSPLKPFPG